MAIFKCKMCGGTISVEEGKSTCQCEFCGTTQTVPSAIDNNKIAVLHNRANSLRLKNEFDKALANYENIIIENPNDAEAHWGALLCRYGIEYVDDPKTGKKIPTCHRTQTKSIFDDIDYKATMDNSDVVAKQLYLDEAEQINKIQKSILAVSVNEKPYDIFICYKESDEYGKRTKDSVIAQELFDELNKKGYKVFFAKITLESKLGSQYEPYIFAALNSAKVMLVIGTKAEYFNAVWVKNEWARFLSIMSESNGKKYIIPCYRDIDAYELPDELLSFQAQDMGKLGFIQDLTRGIDKLFNRNEDKKEEKTNVTQYASGVNVSSLLRRAEILLQSNNKEKANELLDEVLNNEPENAKAYALFAVMDLGFTKESDLEKSKSPLTNNVNYNFAVQFADNNYKMVLKGYNDKILERAQIQQSEAIYQEAINCKNNHKYEEAIRKFESIIDYKDAKVMIDNCKRYIEQFKENKYQQGLDFISKFAYDKALSIFTEIKGYKDSIELISKVNDLLRLESEYKKALNYARNNTISSFNEAILILSDITAYRDSSSLIQKYKEKIEELKARKERTKYLFKRFSIISAICLFFIIVGIVLTINVFIPTHKYNKAMKYIESGNYESANALLLELNGYSDSANQIEIINAHKAFDEDDYETGIDYIYNIGGTVNVTYDGNGGDAEVENEKIKKLSYITHNATRDGYTFYGWTVGEYKIYKSKGEYYCDLSLKSNWDLITYSLKYNLDGGTVTGELPNTYDITNPITLPNPTRKGYTFLGWKEARADNAIIDYVMTDGTFGNKEYTAFWVANKYQLSFELDGGQMDHDSLEVTYDQYYETAKPVKEGYMFGGWYVGKEQITAGIWKYDNNITVKARWTTIDFLINYNLDGGTNSSNNPSKYTVEDTVIIDAPKKIGYTFIGWSISNQSVPSINVIIEKGTTGDITYTANWVANTYNIFFDVNCNDVSSINNITITYGQNYTLPSLNRTGYTFEGWYKDSQKLESGKWQFTSDITLTANWKVIEYTIIYNLDGGTNNSNNPSKYTVEDSLIIDVPTKKGYTFVGWHLENNSNFQNTISITKGTTGDIIASANWNANINTIIFNGNGNTDGNMNSISGATDTSLSLPENSYIRNGYHFIGWSLSEDGEVGFSDKGDYKVTTDSIITLFAKWEPNTNFIVFVGNGNTSGTMSKQTALTDESVYLNAVLYSKDGYHFKGWSTTNDGDVVYTDNQSYTMGFENENYLYAIWEPNLYSITYDANNGNVSNLKKVVTFDLKFVLDIPTREGYSFDGWYYGDSKLTNSYGMSIDIYDYYENIVVSAKWEPNINTLALISGEDNVEISGLSDSWIRIPKNSFSKEGYSFAGWSTTVDGSISYYDTDLFYVGIDSHYELYAIFEEQVDVIEIDRTDWIEISTPSDLFNIKNNLNSKYYLVNDIDMYGYHWTPLILGYTGCFDGNGFTIYNLSTETDIDYYVLNQVDYDRSYKYRTGLFLENYGSIIDLKLVNVNIDLQINGSSNPGNTRSIYYYSVIAGALCSQNYGSIDNCFVYGELSFSKSSLNYSDKPSGGHCYLKGVAIAGICGGNAGNGSTTNCHSSIKINSVRNGYFGEIIPTNNSMSSNYESSDFSDYFRKGYIWLKTENGTYRYLEAKWHSLRKTPNAFETKEDFEFIGWSIEENGDVDFEVGDECFIPADHDYLILYPVWESTLITLTIKYNDGVTNDLVISQQYNTDIQAVANPNRLGYTFIGWSVDIPEKMPKNDLIIEALYSCDVVYEIVDNEIRITGCDPSVNDLYILSSYENHAVTDIEGGSFSDCDNLLSVSIADGIYTIQDNAFSRCYNLSSIYIGSNVHQIGSYAFRDCYNISSIIVSNNNEIFDSRNNCNAIVVTNNNKIYLACSSTTIPSSITEIGDGAFYHCNNLEEIVIPNNIQKISAHAFYECAKLRNVVLLGSNSEIATSTFYNCVSLESITLPTSISTVGHYAFYGCEKLSNVYYQGSQADWNNITIYSNNDYLKNASIHFNYN